jgi:glycosyltransferase involved in cell wall biosynthesis
MSAPRFTVIVPTRERATTLRHCLATITAQDHPDLEILVSDNCSTDDTAAIVAANPDPRIRYINTGRRLSMSHNWELALSHARGTWIGFIGDDDGLLPGALTRLDRIITASDPGLDLVRARPGHFLWPQLLGREGGHLSLPLGGRPRLVSCKAALAACLKGRLHYLELPTLYTGGFVHRRAIERVRAPSGQFFLSRIPDVYSSAILSGSCASYLLLPQPLALNGASAASTGTAQFTLSRDPARNRAAELFLQEDNIPLHPMIPLNEDGSIPRSLQALVFESYLQAQTVHPLLGPLEANAMMRAIAHTGGDHEAEILHWLARFAALNKCGPVPRPGLAGAWHKARAFWKLAYMNRLIFYPEHEPPIRTIAEAAVIGGLALAHAPSPTRAVITNTLRRIGRALAGRPPSAPGRT